MRDSNRDVTYDPGDWEAFRGLCHRMLDDMLDSLRQLDDAPAWQPLPQ